ncbi:MAG: chromosomal replication initiator protein DnaA [Prevotella sp.]|nr:chromosomal replication initiator protein DnaA [Bacteroides sp.]MCM1365899.1 chromosomal replication initiator protein DnaA [Prevotella sp.]
MEEDYKQKWKKCLDIIRDNVGPERFDVWFSCAREVTMKDGSLIISLPSHFFFEKYEDDFCEIISLSLRRVFGRKVPIRYAVNIINNDSKSVVTLSSPERTKHSGTKFTRQMERPMNPLEDSSSKIKGEIESQLNNTFTFDNYCVGLSNKLPYTIAEYIAKNPSRNEFNPFFLYGDVGVGKTHLIQAIGNYIKDTVRNVNVLFIPMRQFQYLLANATVKKQIPAFINWFQKMDVLLIDDLQELSHKEGTMSAIFPIFNSLHQQGKKLIFTCDRPPVELDGISDRLIDRFKWGVTERLNKPDFQLRKQILQFKANKNGLDIPEEIINMIAENATGSVREIEGVVMGILTRSIMTGGEINRELVEQVMSHNIKKPIQKIVNFDMIVETTADSFSLNPDVIFGKSRVKEIAEARQIIMYLTKKHTGLSLPAIGAKLNRKHSTVLHDIRMISSKKEKDSELNSRLITIEKELLR